MASNEPIRLRIVEAIAARLEQIRRGNGYHTDAGEAVFAGAIPAASEDWPDVLLAVTLGQDRAISNLQKKSIQLPVEIHVLARIDRSDPWKQCERARADVMRAMESGSRVLGGLAASDLKYDGTETAEREAGSLDMGLVVTYQVSYTETWGAPESI